VATEVTCVVDTDATATRDYSSLANAIAGETGATPVAVTSADLVSNDEQLTIHCRAGAGGADTTTFTVTGFTTDATRRVVIGSYGTHKHSGTLDTNKYRFSNAASNAFNVSVNCTVENLQFDGRGSDYSSTTGVNITSGTTGTIIIRNCLMFGRTSSTVGYGVLCGSTDASLSVQVINNVMVQYSSGVWWTGTNTPSLTVYNNTFYNCIYGTYVNNSATTPLVRNCIAVEGLTVAYRGGYSGSSSNNISSTDTSLGGSSVTSAVVKVSTDTLTAAEKGAANWVIFNSTSDFSLISVNDGGQLNNAIDAGADLSGTFTTDIIGATRGATWDIGAFEYVAAGGTTLPLFINHYKQMGFM
jgi:hypothetical protein